MELPPALSAGMVYCHAPADRPGGVPGAGFWIDRFEVTVREYREFLAATGRGLAPGAELSSDPWTPGFLPATGVRLLDARAFAEWRGKRIPTSEEWEWAARGPVGFSFPWGDRFVETFANTADLDLRRPTTVGTFFNGRSQFCGAYDLVGNVWEWTESRVGGGFEVRYILRGGSFSTPGVAAMDAPPSERTVVVLPEWPPLERGMAEGPDAFGSDIGFRCVADPVAVERDAALRDAIATLGARDPFGVLFSVLGAKAALERGGAEARRLLERARALNQHALVRGRIESILAGARQ